MDACLQGKRGFPVFLMIKGSGVRGQHCMAARPETLASALGLWLGYWGLEGSWRPEAFRI